VLCTEASQHSAAGPALRWVTPVGGPRERRGGIGAGVIRLHLLAHQQGEPRRAGKLLESQGCESMPARAFMLDQSHRELAVEARRYVGGRGSGRQEDEETALGRLFEPVAQGAGAGKRLGAILSAPERGRGDGSEARAFEPHRERRSRDLCHREGGLRRMGRARRRRRQDRAQPRQHRVAVELVPLSLVGVFVKAARTTCLAGRPAWAVEHRNSLADQRTG
jgi:hypothetical protein